MINISRQQARQIDQIAIHELGIPGIVLMENAGRNATDLIKRYMQEHNKPLASALIFCGGGNNGGDGFVSARHLHNQGVHVRILTTKPLDQLTGDAKTNATICQNMNLSIQPAPAEGALAPVWSGPKPDVIIDALLGTGFQGDLRPDMSHLIQSINAVHGQPDTPVPVVVSLDLPSGLDCDTGQPPASPQGELQPAVRADLTITFAAPKLGFSQPAAWPYLGKFQVADIGIPVGLIERAFGM